MMTRTGLALMLLGAAAAEIALAQDMPYPLASTYIAMSTTGDGWSVTATSVGNTNGSSGHEVAIAANLYNPSQTRAAYASDYYAYYSQATAYLALCSGGICEDGNFTADNTGSTEYCPIAFAYFAAAAASQSQNVPAYVYLGDVKWSSETIPKQNGSRNFEVSGGRSVGCTSQTISLGAGFVPFPAEILYSTSPTGVFSQGCSLANYSCGVSWTLTTSQSNNHTGRIEGHGRIDGNSANCEVKGPWTKVVNLTVE